MGLPLWSRALVTSQCSQGFDPDCYPSTVRVAVLGVKTLFDSGQHVGPGNKLCLAGVQTFASC